MSEIITDKLTGKTSAGDVTITSEGGAVTMQLQQGVAKARALFDQTTPAITDSFNTSSLTDTSSGKGILTWTNSMSSASTYSCTTSLENISLTNPYTVSLTSDAPYVTQSTSAFPFRAAYAHASTASYFDPEYGLALAQGDLA